MEKRFFGLVLREKKSGYSWNGAPVYATQAEADLYGRDTIRVMRKDLEVIGTYSTTDCRTNVVTLDAETNS